MEVLGALTVAHLSAVAFATFFPMHTSRARPKLFLTHTTALGGLFIYVTGWGAVFAVALVAAAAVVIHTEGSRYGPTVILAIVATILVGELAVALGVFQTMIPEATEHGIAVVEAALTALVVGLVTRGQRDKELVESRERGSEERFRVLVQYASDAIIVVADGGRAMYASPAVEHVLGCPAETLESFDLSWIDPDHADTMAEVWRRLRARSWGGGVDRDSGAACRRHVAMGRGACRQPQREPRRGRLRVQHARHRRAARRGSSSSCTMPSTTRSRTCPTGGASSNGSTRCGMRQRQTT